MTCYNSCNCASICICICFCIILYFQYLSYDRSSSGTVLSNGRLQSRHLRLAAASAPPPPPPSSARRHSDEQDSSSSPNLPHLTPFSPATYIFLRSVNFSSRRKGLFLLNHRIQCVKLSHISALILTNSSEVLHLLPISNCRIRLDLRIWAVQNLLLPGMTVTCQKLFPFAGCEFRFQL